MHWRVSSLDFIRCLLLDFFIFFSSNDTTVAVLGDAGSDAAIRDICVFMKAVLSDVSELTKQEHKLPDYATNTAKARGWKKRSSSNDNKHPATVQS